MLVWVFVCVFMCVCARVCVCLCYHISALCTMLALTKVTYAASQNNACLIGLKKHIWEVFAKLFKYLSN